MPLSYNILSFEESSITNLVSVEIGSSIDKSFLYFLLNFLSKENINSYQKICSIWTEDGICGRKYWDFDVLTRY